MGYPSRAAPPAGQFQADPHRGNGRFLDRQQGVAAGKIVAHQVTGESQAGLKRIDLFAQFVAVQRHARFQPQGVAGAQPGRAPAQRPAHVEDCLPNAQGDVAADAQLEAVFAGIAGAADDAALPLGGGWRICTRPPR